MAATRYWDAARAKVRREGRCRACGVHAHAASPLQAAHTIGRRYDERVALEDGGWLLYVEPDDVVPLCPEHHFAYDMRQLDLLPYLTHDEQAAAVSHVGIHRALHRLTGQRSYATPLPV